MTRAPCRGTATRAALLLISAAVLAACATPQHRAEDFAARSNFRREIVTGTEFRHVVYRNSAPAGGSVLHVYIEGDGSPYRRPDEVSPDPTPHRPLMLRLMALDRAPSIYLGRPCYFGLADPGCRPALWTLRRYAPEVLDSMAAALRSQSGLAQATRLELYGHSGGGTLAVLLAQRVAGVTRVVTVGANLDIDAWCALHGYSPLAGSINPAAIGASGDLQARPDLDVLHLVGADDTNTPPWLVQAAAQARGGETVRVIAKFDHGCCWQSLWPEILGQTAAPAAP